MHPLPFPMNVSPIAAAFDVLCVELGEAPGNESFSGAIQVVPQPPDYRQGRRQPQRATPAFGVEVGSLLVFLQQSLYVAAGIVTSVVDGSRCEPFGFTAWPIEPPGQYLPRRYHSPHTAASRPLWRLCDLRVDDQTLIGKVTRLDKLAAAQLRALIGPVAPDSIMDVFWSAEERALFSAKADAQDKYIEGANALLDRLAG